MSSDDTTPAGHDLVAQALHDMRRDERDWRDEVRGQFRDLRGEVGGIRETLATASTRLSVIESTTKQADIVRSGMQTTLDETSDRIIGVDQRLASHELECDKRHSQHASRETVDRLARGHGARRFPVALMHALTALITAITTVLLTWLSTMPRADHPTRHGVGAPAATLPAAAIPSEAHDANP